MSAGLSAAAFIIGAIASLGTSWVLVSRLERVGERLGLSEGLLGMVAALAADSPEITAAITALVHHQTAIGAGVVLGSNVFNLAALLGLAAVIEGRITLHRKVVAFSGAVAMLIGTACLLTVGGQLSAGQAGAAGGFLGLTETIRQLTDAAGARSVKDAKLGLASGFGMVTYDRCLCTGAAILGRAS